MKHKLEDGRIVDIVPLTEKIPTKLLLDHINSLIAEDTFLLLDKKLTLKHEEAWKKGMLKGVRNGNNLYFIAMYKRCIVGTCGAKRDMGKESNNVIIGIAVTKDFRIAGLGEFLIRKTITEVKKKLKPRNIYLHVADPNKPAKALYKKVGFKEMARFPKWAKHKGKYVDVVWMLLK